MSFRLVKTFENGPDNSRPDGILVENHSAQPNLLGYVLNGAYNLVFPGNKHLSLTPELKTFSAKIARRVEPVAKRWKEFLFFRYSVAERRGGAVELVHADGKTTVAFGVWKDAAFTRVETKELATASFALALDVAADAVTVKVGGLKAVFSTTSSSLPEKGLLGFDRDFFPGPLMIDKIDIRSRDRIPAAKPLWPEREYVFPYAVSCFNSDWKFSLKADRQAGLVRVTVALLGGPAEREKLKAFSGFLANEELGNPYLRLEGRDFQWKGYLTFGTVGLREHWEYGQSAFPMADAECPVVREFLFPELPEDCRIVLGYERYRAEDRIHLENVPRELVADPTDGRVLFAGEALDGDRPRLELSSGKDKKICRLIPRDVPRYADALAFAENNHFFFVSERCRFTAIARYRAEAFLPGELTLTAALEDAFFRPMTLAAPVSPALTETNSVLMGVREARSETIDFGPLPIGVYHLTLTARRGGQVVQTETFAFESMGETPDSPCPPLASGIPEFYCLHSDYSSWTDNFDPLLGRSVNVPHYLTGNTLEPIPARVLKPWELTRLYGRKWLLWLATRTTPTPELSANEDLLRHADLAYLEDRVDLWKPQEYRCGRTLEALAEFAEKQGLDGDLAPAAIRAAEKLSLETFYVLVRRHWRPWLEFFNHWYAENVLERGVREYKALNPSGKPMRYGIYPPYGSAYKGSYFSLLTSMRLDRGAARYFPGPLFFEDYPFLCAYPIQRGVYMLAAQKLEDPELRQFPEMYSLTGVPRDTATVYGTPPYGRFYPEPVIFRKRMFEYAYGGTWFRDGKFAYWSDSGFQARNWDRAQFRVGLETWGTVQQVRPAKPTRTAAFVTSVACCLKHPDYVGAIEPNYGWPDIYNTAEEAPAFVYEQARIDGQSAGFLVRPRDLAALSPEDVHTLVLPPLTTLTEEEKTAARRLHAQGVSLLCFESVAGMEDLFGLEAAGPCRVTRIVPGPDAFPELKGMEETSEHPLLVSRYRAAGASVVLVGTGTDGETPVLTLKRNGNAFAACFTIPPTAVRRVDAFARVSYGRESISGLINRAAAAIARNIGKPIVETSAGKLIGFQDTAGNIRIVVEEDAWPWTPKPIQPLVTIRVPNARKEDVSCDRPFTFAPTTADGNLVVRLSLGVHEAAMITLARRKNP